MSRSGESMADGVLLVDASVLPGFPDQSIANSDFGLDLPS